MKKKAVAIVLPITLSLLVAAAILLWFFLRPVVVFVEPTLPSAMLRGLRPSWIDHLKYRIVFLNESEEARIPSLSPSLVIYSPLTRKNSDYPFKSALWGRRSYEGESFDTLFEIDDEKMLSVALEKNRGVGTAFLFSEFDNYSRSLFDNFKKDDPYLKDITYLDRITGVNSDEILKELDENSIVSVILMDPPSSLYLLKNTGDFRVYADFRYASALPYSKVISIYPKWGDAIKRALDGEGTLSFDFALR